MALYHFSEDPGIAVFRPHIAKTSAIRDEPLVWAVDEWHAPMYYLPRDCPRTCFWVGPTTTPEDRRRWLNHLEPRFVMVVESGWLERIRQAQVYCYHLPETSFSPAGHDGGHYLSREVVTPLALTPMGDLLAAILGAGVELRFTPRLGPMWQQIWSASTLAYSGTRLRHALGYPEEFGLLEPG